MMTKAQFIRLADILSIVSVMHIVFYAVTGLSLFAPVPCGHMLSDGSCLDFPNARSFAIAFTHAFPWLVSLFGRMP